MTSAKDELTTLRLSADAFPGRDRVEAFREVFGRTILRIDMEPLQGGGSRLSRAYRMLTDRRHFGRAISAIAFDCGFSDLSYFNRTFRRRYGSTPSDVRELTKDTL